MIRKFITPYLSWGIRYIPKSNGNLKMELGFGNPIAPHLRL